MVRTTLRDFAPGEGDVLARVHQRELVVRGRARFERNELAQEARKYEAIQDDREAGGLLGMTASGIVPHHARIGDDAGAVHDGRPRPRQRF
jgi:hypothetical protein